MQRLWNLFKPRREAEAEALPAQPASAPVAAPSPSSARPASRRAAPERLLDVPDLVLAPPLLDSLKSALTDGAHALLYDPEEFTCFVCALGNGAIRPVAECSLEAYRAAREVLLELDQRVLRCGSSSARARVFNALTDLGQRTVLQLCPPDWDDELVAERRKSNVRLVNRLRPGTSLSQHNRETLLRCLRRAGARPDPGFLERLDREGLVPAEVRDEVGDRLEQVIRREVMPRKTVARILGEYLGVPFVDVEEHLPRRESALLFEKQQVLAWEAIPCGEEEGSVVVAMADPTDADALEAMRRRLGRPVVVKVAAATDIRVAADKIFRGGDEG